MTLPSRHHHHHLSTEQRPSQNDEIVDVEMGEEIRVRVRFVSGEDLDLSFDAYKSIIMLKSLVCFLLQPTLTPYKDQAISA